MNDIVNLSLSHFTSQHSLLKFSISMIGKENKFEFSIKMQKYPIIWNNIQHVILHLTVASPLLHCTDASSES